MELAQLILFVRPPSAGHAKTRLVETFGEPGAAELYKAFVEDTIRLSLRVRAAGRVDVALWSTGPENEIVSAWGERLEVPVRFQPPGDLGAKLAAAFDDGLRDHERVVIIGSDAPTLPIGLIGEAFHSLESAPMMLGPANDGGYYAIGACDSMRPSFERVRWSTTHTFGDTVSANADHHIATIAPWYDVDDPNDIELLRAHLSVDPRAAPATAGYLAEHARNERLGAPTSKPVRRIAG